ncbi:MAG: 3-isopropylmalate dehydratase small subunit [Peptococcaceae bacterium]
MSAKCWKFGHDISTDEIIPVRFMIVTEPAELAKHIMENLDPEFVHKFQPGEIFMAGENFGYGSSREHAALALKAAGVQAIIARSFARIFYRNSINIGLPVLVCPEAVDNSAEGDIIEIDIDRSLIRNLSRNMEFTFQSYPSFIMEFFKRGGLINALNEELSDKLNL